MDLSNIFFTIEFDDDGANSQANELLEKGWLLISVGPKLVSILDGTGQAYYNTSYVVGATKEQYEEYQNEYDQFDDFVERRDI